MSKESDFQQGDVATNLRTLGAFAYQMIAQVVFQVIWVIKNTEDVVKEWVSTVSIALG